MHANSRQESEKGLLLTTMGAGKQAAATLALLLLLLQRWANRHETKGKEILTA